MMRMQRIVLALTVLGVLLPISARVARSQNQDSNEAGRETYTISGTVGLPGVKMTGLPGRVVTNANGAYRAAVPRDFTGTVMPAKEGYTFHPPRRVYNNVQQSYLTEDYASVDLSVPPSHPYGAGAVDVLVIPASEVDPKALVEIREDIQVMLEILREKLSEPRTIMGILYDYGDFFGSGARDAEALYLEGYGALFVMKVDFPLSFGSESRPEEEPEPEADPVWQRARRKLYSPRDARRYGRAGTSPTADEMTFEQFQEDLVKALRHAANIRHIDPNESVILTIIGQGQGGLQATPPGVGSSFSGGAGRAFQGGSYSVSGGSFGPYGGNSYANSHAYSSGSGAAYSGVPILDRYGNQRHDALGRALYRPAPAPAATTVLTIQAKKTDIDAFSQGEIDFDQFQRKVKIFSY